ncbi:hypothetical protein V1512DRAFT_245599 [Lipomyces arxii]|uniref:uncharacterized protein n=1 Tax=Lipomyces arxii TaxID=56418 RepID=UPI0034CEEE56
MLLHIIEVRMPLSQSVQHSSANPSRSTPPVTSSTSSSSGTRQRSAIACRYCRRRKIRCTGYDSNPQDSRCTNCTKFNQQCIFTPVSAAVAVHNNVHQHSSYYVPPYSLPPVRSVRAHSVTSMTDPTNYRHSNTLLRRPSLESYYPPSAPQPSPPHQHIDLGQRVPNYAVSTYSPTQSYEPLRQTVSVSPKSTYESFYRSQGPPQPLQSQQPQQPPQPPPPPISQRRQIHSAIFTPPSASASYAEGVVSAYQIHGGTLPPYDQRYYEHPQVPPPIPMHNSPVPIKPPQTDRRTSEASLRPSISNLLDPMGDTASSVRRDSR